jgi:sugar O-acyltransferase (sialic acid O-acetyltransferase NeuD family)
VVIGASGHARVVIDILRLRGRYEIVGLLDTYKSHGITCSGYEVIGTCRDLPGLIASASVAGAIVAIGDNWVRSRIVHEVRDLVPGFRFVTAVHPSAQIGEDVLIGQGTAIMAGVVVNPGSRVGEFCILNTRASLDHDSVMEPYSSLGPAATTGGGVYVGAFASISIGATVVQEIRIGAHTVIGADATVLHDIPDEVVAYGTPARIIRSRKPSDPYLKDRRSRSVPEGA